MRSGLAPVAAGLIAALSGGARAEPMALVLDIAGAVTPAVAMFEELESGARLTLARDAVVTLLHYASCREVVVTGGALSVGRDAIVLDGGQLRSTGAGGCPRQVRLETRETAVGATTLRLGVGAPTPSGTMAPDAVIVFRDGAQIAEAALARAGVIEVILETGRSGARLPRDAAPLRAGAIYEIVVASRRGALRRGGSPEGVGRVLNAARVEAASGPLILTR